MHNHDGDCDHPSHKAEAKPVSTDGVRGAHVYFSVTGTSADVVYVAAAAAGARVLDFKRVRADLDGATEDREIEVDDPDNEGKTLKRTIKVYASMQPKAYRAILPVGDSREAAAEKARKSSAKRGMELVVEDSFTYVVKAMFDKERVA